MIPFFDLSLYNTDPHVVSISLLIEGVAKGLKDKTISESEYADLMADVEVLKKIIALKNNLELNKAIHDAVVGLIELAKLVK